MASVTWMILLLAITACNNTKQVEERFDGEDPHGEVSAEMETKEQNGFDFSVELYDGKTFNLGEKNGKVVMIVE